MPQLFVIQSGVEGPLFLSVPRRAQALDGVQNKSASSLFFEVSALRWFAI